MVSCRSLFSRNRDGRRLITRLNRKKSHKQKVDPSFAICEQQGTSENNIIICEKGAGASIELLSSSIPLEKLPQETEPSLTPPIEKDEHVPPSPSTIDDESLVSWGAQMVRVKKQIEMYSHELELMSDDDALRKRATISTINRLKDQLVTLIRQGRYGTTGSNDNNIVPLKPVDLSPFHNNRRHANDTFKSPLTSSNTMQPDRLLAESPGLVMSHPHGQRNWLLNCCWTGNDELQNPIVDGNCSEPSSYYCTMHPEFD